MKSIKLLILPLCLVSLFACRNTDDTNNGSNGRIVDYGDCAYIGSGSHYMVTAGSGSSYMTMHFFFDPDGVGAWGSTKIVNGKEVKEVHEYLYILSGGVNISFTQKDNGEKGKGYFATIQSGQVFVTEGVYFYRYS